MRVDETLMPVKRAAAPQAQCFHCGDACEAGVIQQDERDFCCEGCRTVYTLLRDNGLDGYYRINPAAGVSRKNQSAERYAWLDDPDVEQRLLEFSEGRHGRIRLHLPQIHCASCIWLLENLPKLHPGFLNSHVNFPKREASIVYDRDAISLRQAVETLAAIGYPPDIKLDRIAERKTRTPETKLYLQLGIAGFSFGNIMLLSFPEYLGMEAWDGGHLPFYINLFNILLATPVLFYSSQDYFKSAWAGIKYRDWNIDIPIALGMVTLYVRSLYEIATDLGPGYLDSLAGLAFFLLTGKWFQRRTYQQLSFDRDYKSYFPVAAQRLDAKGEEQSVTLDKLAPGDEVIIRHSELIPADARLVSGRANIDYSFVTGEAEPVAKQPGERLFAGGRQEGEAIRVLLERRVDQSYLTRLWEESDLRGEADSSASGIAKRVGRYFTGSILTVGVVSLAYWWPQDPTLAINAFTAVLIIACPCALALAVPFTLGNAMRLLGRVGAYLKNTEAIERMASVDAIVFDKTGTLTAHREPQVAPLGQTPDSPTRAALLALARQSAHPMSQAIAQWLRRQGADGAAVIEGFEEQTGKGIAAVVDGRPLHIGSRSWARVTEAELAGEAEVFWRWGNGQYGGFAVRQAYREGLDAVLSQLAEVGELHLLSGDNEREARHLQPLFPAGAQLRFRQSPHDKLAFIRQLSENGKKVLMIGDGLNDAGALRRADVGLVITETANNFTPASDAIFEGARFNRLPDLLRFARGSVRLVYFAFFLALLYNVVGLSFAVRGALSPVVAAILMPLSSITIVAFGVAASTILFRKLKLWGPDHKDGRI